MKSTIIKGAGNSRSIRTIPGITAERLLELITSEEGLPVDIGPLNPAGCEVVGTDLTPANLLKDSTAGLVGLSDSAVPDDALVVLAASVMNGKKVIIFDVKTEDGNPLSGVRIFGLLDAFSGETPTTNEDGKCFAVIDEPTSVSAKSPYLDTEDVDLEIPVPDGVASTVSITIPDFDISGVREITVSGDYKVARDHNVEICCIQGGTGGTGGEGGSYSNRSNTAGTPPGNGGAGGGVGTMKNGSSSLLKENTYTAILGSGGSGGAGGRQDLGYMDRLGSPGRAGGHTQFNGIDSEGGEDTIPLNIPDLVNLYYAPGETGDEAPQSSVSAGSKGGTGGKGGGKAGKPGDPGYSNSGRNGGAGGTGGTGGPGCGGGGGGGGGSSGEPTGGVKGGTGGTGGEGGSGVVLIKFFD